MKQFDVFPTPNAADRAVRPYILVLQHERIDSVRTVVVAPLARAGLVRGRDRLLTKVQVSGEQFVLIAHELSAIDRRHVRGPIIDNLEAHRYAIMNAIDLLFSAAP